MNRRQWIFISLLLAAALTSFAQEASDSYRPFVEEGKVWNYEGSNPNHEPSSYVTWTESYQLDGDTVIDSYKCGKLYFSSTCPFSEYHRLYKGAVYEDGNKVYIFHSKSTAPRLLYDFSCKKEDHLMIGGYELLIDKDYFISNAAQTFHVFVWSPKEMNIYQSFMIEGIGCLDDDLINYYEGWLPGGYQRKLLSCSIKGFEIFNYNTFHKEVSTVSFPFEQNSTPTLFDLSGRRLSAPPAKGIYIENGQKRVAKGKE